MFKMILLGTAALSLTACGGEKYAVPASEAYQTLSSIGTPTGVSPLPAGLSGVSVSFDTPPSDSQARWRFSHDGSDIGSIIATVAPSGDKASVVSLTYAEGTAPDSEWQNRNVRTILKGSMQSLIAEAIDSRFDQRPFDMELYRKVSVATLQSNIGGIMKDVSSSMDKEIARRAERDAMSDAQANNPYTATKPAVDLSKTN
ncbi:MAG: hypothetical protein ABIN83_05080 [Sphingomicrobium sp.]